jgi:hypothetical protein
MRLLQLRNGPKTTLRTSEYLKLHSKRVKVWDYTKNEWRPETTLKTSEVLNLHSKRVKSLTYFQLQGCTLVERPRQLKIKHKITDLSYIYSDFYHFSFNTSRRSYAEHVLHLPRPRTPMQWENFQDLELTGSLDFSNLDFSELILGMPKGSRFLISILGSILRWWNR